MEQETAARRQAEFERLRSGLAATPWDGKIAAAAIRVGGQLGRLDEIRAIFLAFERTNRRPQMVLPHLALAAALIDAGAVPEALALLARLPPGFETDRLEGLVLRLRAHDEERVLAELATFDLGATESEQVLLELARRLWKWGRRLRPEDPRRTSSLSHAIAAWRRVIVCTEHPRTRGRAFHDLARALACVRAPPAEVDAAFLSARALLPRHEALMRDHENWRRPRGLDAPPAPAGEPDRSAGTDPASDEEESATD